MIFNYNTILFSCSFFPGCGPSSVIEIVKVKYNRIDIKKMSLKFDLLFIFLLCFKQN